MTSFKCLCGSSGEKYSPFVGWPSSFRGTCCATVRRTLVLFYWLEKNPAFLITAVLQTPPEVRAYNGSQCLNCHHQQSGDPTHLRVPLFGGERRHIDYLHFASLYRAGNKKRCNVYGDCCGTNRRCENS